MSNLVVADRVDLPTDDQADTGTGLLEQSNHGLVIHAADASPVHLSTYSSLTSRSVHKLTFPASLLPRTHGHLANRAFAVAAPSSWNSLPDNVRDSKSCSNFYQNLKLTIF